MQIPDVNLEAFPEQATRQLIGPLLNLVEALVAENTAQRSEIQQLRDALARLKGASPRPAIKPPVPPGSRPTTPRRRSVSRTPRAAGPKRQKTRP